MTNKKTTSALKTIILVLIFISITIVYILNQDSPFSTLLLTIDLAYFIFMYFSLVYLNRSATLSKLPTLKSPATLIEKTQGGSVQDILYFLIFELDNGHRIQFQVEREIFSRFSEADKGLLVYKEKNKTTAYINFIKG